LALDAAGNVYIAGVTSSATDFPLVNALQPTYGGGYSNAFVAEMDNAGTELLFSTYLGGTGRDAAGSPARAAPGTVYLTGTTTLDDFPTVNALQPSLAGTSDAFVTKLTADGSMLVYSTYLGGSGDENLRQNGVMSGALAVDGTGGVYLIGNTTSSDF